MSKAKKVFTNLCLNNWGGINHEIIELHEYVNLFSGKSGSGKSTVMDAVQVILYGSFSSSFLNKAADDAKNRRSVLSYLRGEQKDGTANRENKDFCSTIVLEVEDKGTHITNCVGLAFEVRKSDSELRRFTYFSHSGSMPVDGYINENGVPYTIKEIKELISKREKSEDNRGKFDVNRTYATKESYLSVLNDGIMGYVDGNRFTTMEKSAIALRMTNGTGQFIRDYMFPKSTGETIQRISDELGAYRQIKSQIEDLKVRIDSLEEIRKYGQSVVELEADQLTAKRTIQCMDIIVTKQKIQEKTELVSDLTATIAELKDASQLLNRKRKKAESELIQVSAKIQASDLGVKIQALEELDKRGHLLASAHTEWKHILDGLSKWEEDEIISEYVSNPMLNRIQELRVGQVSQEQCDILRGNIESTKQNLEEEYESHNEEKREQSKVIVEKRKIIDDIRNDRKPYNEQLRKAKSALSQKLSTIYGRTIAVYVFADLFDVAQEEWKDALEGRLGRLKTSLITEPQYAHEAATIFRRMKEFESVEFIHSKAVQESHPVEREHSLYESVKTEYGYVDICLKRYLGNVIKCDSIEELESVRDGVTKDCYAFSNFIFRHLKKKDYTTFACIGTKVSKAKLKEYEEELLVLQKEYADACSMVEAFKGARNFEGMTLESGRLVALSSAGNQLESVVDDKVKLNLEIQQLREGSFKQLETREAELEEARNAVDIEIAQALQKTILTENHKNRAENDMENATRELKDLTAGYVANEEIESRIRQESEKKFSIIRNQQNQMIGKQADAIQVQKDYLQKARILYIKNYPNCGFSGAEVTNDKYELQLKEYQNDYEAKYLVEFEAKASFVYKSLRDNVISTIHGDIRAAKRHTIEVNRLLRDTNFSDSTYQIKIEAAKDENGQFYEMLMAEELDSKNIDNCGFDGQLSFGEDTFYQKYEQKINLLLEKFMPPSHEDNISVDQRQKEMERYSDYRNYLSFSMFEQVTDESGNVIRENFVDDMAGKDSGGEGQNPKYVALLAGFAMLYMQQNNRNSKIKLVLLDEAFSKMDQERSAVCLKYARKMDLQLIVCVPDERLQSLIRNVDSVHGFRRYQNQIQMMHINKGDYLRQLEGAEEE